MHIREIDLYWKLINCFLMVKGKFSLAINFLKITLLLKIIKDTKFVGFPRS